MDADLRALRDWGASTVVMLMETHELEFVCVPDLGERVSRTGLRWWHLPMVDGGVPDARFEYASNRAGEDLRRRLVAGERIVVLCRGGLGRTGIVAARLQVEFGEEPESALFRVRRARTGTVENWLHEEFVRDWWRCRLFSESGRWAGLRRHSRRGLARHHRLLSESLGIAAVSGSLGLVLRRGSVE